MKALDLITECAKAVNDPALLSYTNQNWIDALNDGIRAVVGARPEIATVRVNHTCTNGALQNLANTDLLIRVLHCQTGKALLPADLIAKDQFNPLWRAATPTATPDEWMMIAENPREFEVSPPATTGCTLTVLVSRAPAVIDDSNDDLPISDLYAPALREWMLYRFYSRDDEDTPNYQRGEAHKATFGTLLNLKK